MHVLIINGSPRIQKLSNTDKIIHSLIKGMEQEDKDLTYELYSVSDRKQWKDAREAFAKNDEILIALPLYVECIPGLLLEFLSTLDKKEKGRISFVLQSGFAEASQLRCGEGYLKRLPAMLGCEYGGTLIRGDNFSIRFNTAENNEKILTPYEKMGASYIRNNGFESDEAKAFAGPEYFPRHIRIILRFVFSVFVSKVFNKTAKGLGCTKPLDYRPY